MRNPEGITLSTPATRKLTGTQGYTSAGVAGRMGIKGPSGHWIWVQCPTCRGEERKGRKKCPLCKGKRKIKVPPLDDVDKAK